LPFLQKVQKLHNNTEMQYYWSATVCKELAQGPMKRQYNNNNNNNNNNNK